MPLERNLPDVKSARHAHQLADVVSDLALLKDVHESVACSLARLRELRVHRLDTLTETAGLTFSKFLRADIAGMEGSLTYLEEHKP
jgi:hypothetical protein